MKTAEQWAEEFEDLENEGVIDFIGKNEIRAIQADALRHAAAIVNETRIPSLVSMIEAEAQKLNSK